MVWIGDWWRFGEEHYGERLKELRAEGDEKKFGLYMNAAWVARSFQTTSRRREVLLFDHHQTVAPLEPAIADRFLVKATAKGWSREDLRRAIRQHKLNLRNARLSEAAVLSGEYTVILADPPWEYNFSQSDSREKDLSFAAGRLMIITRHEILSKRAHAHILHPSWFSVAPRRK